MSMGGMYQDNDNFMANPDGKVHNLYAEQARSIRAQILEANPDLEECIDDPDNISQYSGCFEGYKPVEKNDKPIYIGVTLGHEMFPELGPTFNGPVDTFIEFHQFETIYARGGDVELRFPDKWPKIHEIMVQDKLLLANEHELLRDAERRAIEKKPDIIKDIERKENAVDIIDEEYGKLKNKLAAKGKQLDDGSAEDSHTDERNVYDEQLERFTDIKSTKNLMDDLDNIIDNNGVLGMSDTMPELDDIDIELPDNIIITDDDKDAHDEYSKELSIDEIIDGKTVMDFAIQRNIAEQKVEALKNKRDKLNSQISPTNVGSTSVSKRPEIL